jgi:GT2 family glycosyltransferase
LVRIDIYLVYRMIKEANRRPPHATDTLFPSRNQYTPSLNYNTGIIFFDIEYRSKVKKKFTLHLVLKMKDLSVVTVTHQSAQFIEDQVFSVISGSLKLSIEQIVIDNASSDATLDVLDRLSHLITVIKNEVNVGFAAANNQGLQFANGRYLLFLNPDMQVKEGSLDTLVDWMDSHPKVGITSCMLVDALGRALTMSYPKRLPRLSREILWLLRLNRREKKNQLKLEGEPQAVEMVKGAFMLVRRELIEKLGFAFDPRYFLLYEDTDLCREAQRLGYEISYHPSIQCVDFNSRSFSVKRGIWIYRCFTKSMLSYFFKWEPWYCWMWIALFIPIGYLLRLNSSQK